MGYKIKTKKAAAKRFPKATANGKILRSKRNHGHFNARLGGRLSNKLAGTAYVDINNFATVDKLVPHHKAKKKRTKYLQRVAKVAAALRAQSKASKEA